MGTTSSVSATVGLPRGRFQLTEEGIEDNNYAARWLAERGFPPVVIGHGNGGMLAVKHVADHPETPAMVLLSAHGGGRDEVQRSLRAGMLAGDRLDEITARARALVASFSLRSPLSSAGIRVLIPPLVPDHGLEMANALDTASYAGIEIIGPALAAVC